MTKALKNESSESIRAINHCGLCSSPVQGTGWHLVHTCCIRFRKDIHSLVAGIITSRGSLDKKETTKQLG